MAKIIESSKIKDLFFINYDFKFDDRGSFCETYRQEWFNNPSYPPIVQTNRSYSNANILRGLHYHLKQIDIWNIQDGQMLVLLHDLRQGSPTQNSSLIVPFSSQKSAFNILIPPGVAHGFYCITNCILNYSVNQYYDNTDEFGVLYNDKALNFNLDIDPVISARDANNPLLKDLKDLPKYG